MNWKQNKIFFNFLSNKKYFIKKNSDSNDILYIIWNNFNIKCKYFLLFSVDTNNNIFWSCDNPFIDNKTKFLYKFIKNTCIHLSTIFTTKLINFIKIKIQNDMFIFFDNQKINLLWLVIGQYKDFKQFYIITDIIYF